MKENNATVTTAGRVSDLSVDVNAVSAEICRRSFYGFVQRFWGTVIAEKPVWNWHLEFLCDEMQRIAERVFAGQAKEHDLVINVPPGSSKSTIVSIMFPAWCWTRMPSCRIAGVSYSEDPAKDNSRKCLKVINSEKFKRLFPGIVLTKEGETFFENTSGGFRLAVGIGGAVMGRHFHFIVTDDPIKSTDALSDVVRKITNTFMKEGLSTRKVDKSISVEILVMQRLHEDDPSGQKLSGGTAVRHICLPSELTDDVSPKRVRNRYVNGLLDATRMDRATLDAQRVSLGEYGYAGQFLQRPSPAEGGMFSVGRIRTTEPMPEMAFKVRGWDKAGTHGGGCYTVGALLGIDAAGRFWILDIVRGQWDSAERERKILETAKKDGIGVRVALEQEPGSGGKESAEGTAKRLAGYYVVLNKVSGDKVTRAYPLSVQVNAGNVAVDGSAPWVEELKHEMGLFPNSRYKDQVDACSVAFSLLTKARTEVGVFSLK